MDTPVEGRHSVMPHTSYVEKNLSWHRRRAERCIVTRLNRNPNTVGAGAVAVARVPEVGTFGVRPREHRCLGSVCHTFSNRRTPLYWVGGRIRSQLCRLLDILDGTAIFSFSRTAHGLNRQSPLWTKAPKASEDISRTYTLTPAGSSATASRSF